MHFSALTILACAFVAVTARPVANVVSVDTGVDIHNVGNDNTVAIANGILSPKRDGLVTAIVPIAITDVLNHNVVAVGNHVLRDAVSVAAPVTIEEIFDCNDIRIANDILNILAAELGRLVAALGITADDILACNPGNWHTLVDKLYAHVGKPAGLGARADAATDPNAPLLGLLGVVVSDIDGLVGLVAPPPPPAA